MITMVLIASGGLMLTMYLLRTSASHARRERGDGIRWRGIDWSRAEEQPDEDHFKKSQD